MTRDVRQPLAGGRSQRNIALLVAATFFMENLDGTILTTAAPSIGLDFGVASFEVGVTITAYLLTVAVLIPLSGWLAQRLGTKQVFLAAIAVFTVASVLCAASSNLTELTASRVLQGAGGALMVPVGRLAVLRLTEKRDLVRVIALLTWPALLAPVLAPLVGGVLTTYASWHWIFLVNVPLGVVAVVVAVRILPAEKRVAPPPLDWIGVLLTGTALGTVVWLGSLLAARDSDALTPTVLAIAGALLTVAAGVWLVRARHPLLELPLMRIETFRQAHGLGSMFRITISAVPFLLPLLFQDAFGYTPIEAGTLVLFVFVGNIGIKPFTTPLLRRFGFRPVLIASTAAAALSMGLCALLTASTPVVLTILLLTFSGVARSVGFTAYNTIGFADIEPGRMTAANTLSSTLQQMAAGFGVAIAAVALRAGQAIADGAAGGVGAGGAVDGGVGGAVADAAAGATALLPVGAFQFSFLVIGAMTLLSTYSAVRLSAHAGHGIRPPRPAAR